MDLKRALFAVILSGAAFHSWSTSSAEVAPPPAPESAVSPDDQSLDDLTSPGVVTYAGHEIIPQGKCQYFHQKAIETSERDWWVKYQKCEQG